MKPVAAGIGVLLMSLTLIAIISIESSRVSLFPSIIPTIFPTPSATAQPQVVSTDLKSFASFDEVSSFLSSAQQSYGRGGYGAFDESFMVNAPLAKAGDAVQTSASGASDYSTTNVQVEGVDEADVFKTDGKFIYTLSGGKIIILNAFPAEELKILSTLESKKGQYTGLFVNGDRLVAFGSESFAWDSIVTPLVKEIPEPVNPPFEKRAVGAAAMPRIMPDYYYPQEYSSSVKIYDISDRANPRLLKTIDSRGNYLTARMIGERVYVVFQEYAQASLPRPIYAVDGVLAEIAPSEIGFFDYPFDSYYFTTVLGFDVFDLEKEESRKVVLTGGGQTVFVSKENAYIAYTQYNIYYPLWEAYSQVLSPFSSSSELVEKIKAISESDASEWRKDNLKVQAAQNYLQTLADDEQAELLQKIYEKEQEIREKQQRAVETTVVHKFGLGQAISYQGKGSVPGHVLNQFSMDEFDGYLRVATTTGQVWDEKIPSESNVYVLDSALKTVGKLEDLAPGEQIYSVRFMGNRAYLVTFKKVDPLFVIDLSDARNPQLLGKLKIPGYSEYLHPYDETHLIGLGKDAVPAEEGDFAWYQGVKLSLFDVSDVANPRELATYSIGDRGTDSYALQDHKAFLFDRERNLLVIPVLLAEIDESKYPTGVEPHAYGEYKFQGAYVFKTDLTGFELRGQISHADPERFAKAGEYYFGTGTDVIRSAYLDDVLYTISERMVKANDLNTLAQKGEVELPYPDQGDLLPGDVEITGIR